MKNTIVNLLGADHPWVGSIHYYDTIGSTNDEAKHLAEQGAPHGTVLIAGTQTGGRGRMGRRFHSPAGTGIYLSVILRPARKAADLMHLTCGVAVAVCDAIEAATGFRPGVKWINDIVANNKKLGGILTELSLESDGRVRYAVVGIGLNCKQKANDFPAELQDIATSLEAILDTPVSVPRILAELLVSLEALSDRLSEQDALMDLYRADCITLGKEISVIRGNSQISGTAIFLENDGSLIVRTNTGEQIRVDSGEVQVRGLYGYC